MQRYRDAPKCFGEHGFVEVIVGSSDPVTGGVAEHSNRGSCVDVYAPGQSIVVGGAARFYWVASGTSFATPMVTRLVTQRLSPSSNPQVIKDFILKLAGPNGVIPALNFPEELLFGLRASSKGSGRLGIAALPLLDMKQSQPADAAESLERARKSAIIRELLGAL